MPHYKILVIDYEPRGVAQLRDPLHAAGYLVSVAHDGVTGSKLFEEIEPDLTLVEAMLPKKHGFEVCRDLKKTPHGAKSPVVIVTSVYRGRKYRTQAFHNYHCDEFLEKPISSATLLSTVERLLQDRPLASAEPAAAQAPPEPEAKTKPEPKPEEKPEPKPAPAEPAAAAAATPTTEDEAELEISERLDELLGGGGSGSGPQASGATGPSDDENVLSFDPFRGRGTGSVADTSTVPGGPRAGTSGSGPASAEAIRAEQTFLPEGRPRPTIAPQPWPEIREGRSRAHRARRRAAQRSLRLLLLTILLVALASSAFILLLNWPF